VTIADIVGDIDPIKAARSGLQLSNELTMHYGLLPRANRGIFAINELPDLAGKIRSGCSTSSGRRRPDQGLSGAAAARHLMAFTRESRGLHGARQDHHAAQGPHRLRDPDALPGRRGRGDGHHRAGSWMQRERRRARGRGAAFVAKSSRRSRFRRGRIAASTSARASASACRSR
jgi:hypothetical protein